MLKAEPQRMKLLKDIADPRFEKLRIESELPSLA
jgi:hypothetical protein